MENIYLGKFSNIFISNEVIYKKVKIREMFIREVEIHKELNHENIVKFIDFIDPENTLILEYCNLGNIKNCNIQMESIIMQLASGLNYLHSRNIIHRDIKPSNILVSGNTLKISDFGLSKIKTSKYIKSSLVGTLNYMSPEIIKNQYYNEKTDIWSLGCTFFFIINKKNLINEETDEETKNAIINYDFGFENTKYKKLLKNMIFTNKNERISSTDILNSNLKKVRCENIEEQNDIEVENGIIKGNMFISDEKLDGYPGDMLIYKSSFFAKIIDFKSDNEIEIEEII